MAQLQFANKWLREMTTMLLSYIPEPYPPGFKEEHAAMLKQMAADVPPEWPKMEPEVQTANLLSWLRKLGDDA